MKTQYIYFFTKCFIAFFFDVEKGLQTFQIASLTFRHYRHKYLRVLKDLEISFTYLTFCKSMFNNQSCLRTIKRWNTILLHMNKTIDQLNYCNYCYSSVICTSYIYIIFCSIAQNRRGSMKQEIRLLKANDYSQLSN